MRRMLIRFAAGLEITGAVLLLLFAWHLPGAAEVETGVGRVENVSRKAGKQVRGLSGQVGKFRQRLLNRLFRFRLAVKPGSSARTRNSPSVSSIRMCTGCRSSRSASSQ